MATAHLPGAVRPANPTRRAFIGAASLAMPLAAMATVPLGSGPCREWDRLVGEFHAADAKMKTVGTAHREAETAFMQGSKLLGDRPQPPRVVYSRPIEEMTVGQLRDLKAPSHKQAQYEADIADWQARHDELEQRTIGDLEDRWNNAVSDHADASNAVLLHPAPDREALLFKLDLAERVFEGCDLDTKVTSRIFSDVRRFARGEA